MKTYITKMYSGTNKSKCTIIECETNTNNKVRIITDIEGFAVYLAYLDYLETTISAFKNYSIVPNMIKQITQIEEFEQYIEFLKIHKPTVKRIHKLSESDFLEKTYINEVKNLEIFEKFIEHFETIDNHDKFMNYCNSFIDWLKPEESKKDKTLSTQELPKKPSIDDDMKKAKDILKPLCGYWNREKIMNIKDFETINNFVISIIENNSLPSETKQIPITNVSTEFIRKTFYEIYKYLGKKNREEFSNLVHLFKQFDNTEETTTGCKFSNYTGEYNNDIETMITY